MDQPIPATSCFVQDMLGAKKAAAFDMQAGCSGFVYALGVADQFIRCGTYKNVLVIGGEVLSKFVDWKDRATCVLFGDGAGAVLLSAEQGEHGLLSTSPPRRRRHGRLHHPARRRIQDPREPRDDRRQPPHHQDEGQRDLQDRRALHRGRLPGRHRRRPGLSPADVRWFVPHQANTRIINAVADRLGWPPEDLYLNIDRIGNTSAGSIPIALDEMVRAGKVAEGDILLFAAFGAGLTWGSALVRW